MGTLAVEYHSRTLPTSTLYIDCNQLIQWISVTDDSAEPSWTELLYGSLRQMFDITRNIRATLPREVPVLETLDTFPESLKSFFQTVRACAVVFDDALLPESHDMLPSVLSAISSR